MGRGEDRISELPDSVLQYILSFLPTKCSVSTSIVSKRWKYLWTSVPVIDFRRWDNVTTATEENFELYKETFMNFVDRLLSCRDTRPIEKFFLQCNEGADLDESRVFAWIATVTNCKLEELYLSLCKELHELPPGVFTCESLIMMELDLYNHDFFVLPESISLPRLKVLRLSGITFGDDNLTENFFSNCPVLEELTLSGCSWWDMNVVSISAPALKSLDINGGCRYNSGLYNSVIKIYAPSLMSLRYNVHLAEDYVLSSFSSLVDADIAFLRTLKELSYGASKLLGGISNVKLLKMSGRTFKVLSVADILLSNLPTFCNLIHLEVKWFPCLATRTLFDFLQILPNLESLVFAKGWKHRSKSDCSWTINLVPQCLLLHLKSVEFQGFYGHPCMLNVVKLLLKNASALQKMTLVSYSILSTDLKNEVEEAKEQLLMFPRGSTDCVISFTSSYRF